MPLKVVFFYNQYKQGFSETYYINSAIDPQAWLDTLPGSAIRGLTDMRGLSTVLWAVRASTVDAPRKSAIRLVRGDFGGLTFPAMTLAQQLSDVVSTTAVLRLFGALGKPRRVFLRGLRDIDTVIDTAGTDNPSATLIGYFKKYVNALKTLSLCIKYTVLPPDGGKFWFHVSEVHPQVINSAYAACVIGGIVAWPGNMNTGDYVVFQGAPSTYLPKWPRIAQIVARTAGAPWELTIAYRVPSQSNLIPAKMRLTQFTPAYDAITTGEFERFSEHKTGKPFGMLRGRSKGLKRVL